MMIRQQQKGPTPGDARREYGSRGRVGIVTPQSNPTVEPEISLLLPDGVSMLTTRCTSRGEPRQRVLDYFNELSDTLRSFDGMALDSLGFACTASSYLLAEGEEATARDRLEQQFGYPVVTAAGAANPLPSCTESCSELSTMFSADAAKTASCVAVSDFATGVTPPLLIPTIELRLRDALDATLVRNSGNR